MPPLEPTRHPLRRSTCLKTTGTVTAGAALFPYLVCTPRDPRLAEALEAGPDRALSISRVNAGLARPSPELVVGGEFFRTHGWDSYYGQS